MRILLTARLIAFALCLLPHRLFAADWEPAGWGGGGFYQAAVFDPTTPGVIYLAGDVGGCYKSVDHGKTWTVINKGISSYGVYTLAIDRKNPRTLYAGTTRGLSKSVDAGATWHTVPNSGTKELNLTAQRSRATRSIAVDPTNSDVLYVGNASGKIHKSADGSATWREVYQTATDAIDDKPVKNAVRCVVVADANPSMVVAATENEGILLSDDAGTTWKKLRTPARVASVAVAPSDANLIYAACFLEGVWKSADRGATWAKCSTGIAEKVGIIDVAISPTDPNSVAAIGRDDAAWNGYFYYSTDAGATWTESSRVQPDAVNNPTRLDGRSGKPVRLSLMCNLAMNPANPSELLLAGNWRVPYSSDGGKTWEERSRGADISCITDIRFLDGKAYASAMDEGVFVSSDDGGTWKQLWPFQHSTKLSGHYWQLAINKVNGVDRIISTCSPWNGSTPSRIVHSSDGGKTYKETLAGLPDYRPNVNVMWGLSYPRALAVDPSNPQTVYLGIDGDAVPGKSGGGIFRSTDGGATWKQLPAQPASRRMFNGLVVDPTDSKRLFWGACGTNGGIYRSIDAGESWERVFTQSQWIFNLKTLPDGTIYAVGTTGCWRSTDHGTTWRAIASNLGVKGYPPIIGLEVDPRDPRTIWISGGPSGDAPGGAVWKTTDAGATWTDITGNLPYAKPMVLRFNPATNELWAGHVGLYRIKQ